MPRFEGDHSEGILSSFQGVPNHGSALTAGLFVCPFVYLVFFRHIHSTRMSALRQRLAQQGTGGSVVEF